MPQRILGDTDILVDIGREVKQAQAYLKHTEKTDRIFISVITYMELMVGCRNKTEMKKLDRFLKRFEVIQINQRVSEMAVVLLRKYRHSHGLLLSGALIAASALTEQIRFISKNQRHFRFIDSLILVPY